MIEDLKKTLDEASWSYQQILQQTHSEALMRNEVQAKRWMSYKREHEELSGRLFSFRDKLSHTVMVPLGNKAMMRGKLVHTNEILVCLGDGWFVKQSAQEAVGICQRRIQHCDEILSKLKKEEELLNSRKSFVYESDAFGGEHTQELIEPYNEEAEKQWRESHRQKEREYRQKLAELKKTQTNKITTEEDLWRRLDDLDMQEELEDELNRMDEDDEEEVESDDELDSSSDPETNISQVDKESVENTNTLKRRVSFKDDKKESVVSEENIEDSIHLSFKHTDAPSPVPSSSEGEIMSPADIYTQYMKQRLPKSILKQSSSVVPIFPEDSVNPKHFQDRTVPETPALKAVSEDVVERTSSDSAVVTCERPISRFKAARTASKR